MSLAQLFYAKQAFRRAMRYVRQWRKQPGTRTPYVRFSSNCWNRACCCQARRRSGAADARCDDRRNHRSSKRAWLRRFVSRFTDLQDKDYPNRKIEVVLLGKQ